MKHTCLSIVLLISACSGTSSEAPRIELPVVPDESGLTEVTNDLGWTVEVESATASMSEVVFTTDGEASAMLLDRATQLLVASAWAHPGHLVGGEVIGELPGDHVVDFFSDEPLGTATLIRGGYDGANFTFTTDDSLEGGSIVMEGMARRDDARVRWRAVVIQDESRTVIGVPMDVDLTVDEPEALALQLGTEHPTDASRTLFDGIDFGESSEVELGPESAGGIRLLRASQRHDFWRVVAR